MRAVIHKFRPYFVFFGYCAVAAVAEAGLYYLLSLWMPFLAAAAAAGVLASVLLYLACRRWGLYSHPCEACPAHAGWFLLGHVVGLGVLIAGLWVLTGPLELTDWWSYPVAWFVATGVRWAIAMMDVWRLLFLRFRPYVLYCIFGVCTTTIELGLYYLMLGTQVFSGAVVAGHEVDYLLASVLAWICAILFSYFTNRKWVFDSRKKGAKMFLELLRFALGRLITLGLQTVCLWLLVDTLHWNKYLVRLPLLVIITILNYIISRMFSFGKKPPMPEKETEETE